MRTLFILLAVFFFVVLLVSTIHLNQSLVAVEFAFAGPMTVQLWKVMLAAFGAGAAIILLFDIEGGARRFARNWKAQQRLRAQEKTEELYWRGLRDLENGRAEQALSKFDQVLSRDGQHLLALMKRGDSLRALRRYREAVSTLEQAIRLAPDNVIALYHLTDVYLESEDLARAEEILRRIIRLDPHTTVSAHRKLADLKVRQHDWAAGDELCGKIEKMLTLEGEKKQARAMSLGIRFELGLERFGRADVKGAISSFETVLEWDRSFCPAYCRLGEAERAAGNTARALEVWRRGYQVTGSIEPLSAIEEHWLEAEQPEEAIAAWKEAIAAAADETPLRYCLGKLYHRLFMLDEALNEFRLVEERVANLPALHLYVARILESKGDLDGALAEYETLVDQVGDQLREYCCSSCQKRSERWADRCEHCARWNTVALDVKAAVSPEPTIRPAPTWSIS